MSNYVVLCVTDNYGMDHAPVYVTYKNHAEELKTQLDAIVKRINKYAKSITQTKVVSIWKIDTFFTDKEPFNPYTMEPQIIGCCELNDVYLYDTKYWDKQKLLDFDKNYIEKHPEYAEDLKRIGTRKYFELDYKKTVNELRQLAEKLELANEGDLW